MHGRRNAKLIDDDGDLVGDREEHYVYDGDHIALVFTDPDGKQVSYLLRRFAHTNEGSCAIQVFWNPGDPVVMAHLA